MFSRFFRFTAATVLCLLFSSSGGLRAEYKPGPFYVNPVLAHWMNYKDPNTMDDGPLWGARFGLNLCPFFGIEGFVLRGPTEISPQETGVTKVGASYGAYGAAARMMYPAGPVIPFLTVGWGRATLKPDHALSSINGNAAQVESSEKRNLAMFGAGLEVPVHRNISLRFDAIDHYLSRDFIDGDWRDCKTHNWELGGSIVLLFGHPGEKTRAPAPVVKFEPKPEEKVIVPVSEMSEPEVVEKVKILAAEPKIIILAFEDVHFDFDKATLKEEAKVILKRSVQILKDNPKTKVRIAGYTSASGTRDYNQALSERRAKAVEEYLIQEGIVTPDRLSIIGYGETRPAEYEAAPKNLYSKAAKANMRVLFEIIVK